MASKDVDCRGRIGIGKRQAIVGGPLMHVRQSTTVRAPGPHSAIYALLFKMPRRTCIETPRPCRPCRPCSAQFTRRTTTHTSIRGVVRRTSNCLKCSLGTNCNEQWVTVVYSPT